MTTVLKLGGSVITDKSTDETVDQQTLERITEQLATVSPARLLVVHGGGSFGHPVAERHGVASDTPTRDPEAIADIHEAMLALNAEVTGALRDGGLAPIGVHPLSFCVRSDGEIQIPTEAVESMLAGEYVPVLHGDGVVTDDRSVTILSGDDIAVELAAQLECEHLGFCSRAGGVLDANGDPIDRIDDISRVENTLAGTEATDVTGGMRHKVELALSGDVTASIFGPEELAAFLRGERPGTTIVP